MNAKSVPSSYDAVHTTRAHGNVFERFHLCFHAKTDANTNNLLQKLELIQYIENIFPWSV